MARVSLFVGLFAFAVGSLGASYQNNPYYHRNPYTKRAPARQKQNTPPKPIGYPALGGILFTVPVGQPRTDIFGNIYQRTSENVGFVNGKLFYRTDSGFINEDAQGFQSNSDRTPNVSEFAYTNRFAGQPPKQFQETAQNYQADRRRAHETSDRYRQSLPEQYRRHPYHNN